MKLVSWSESISNVLDDKSLPYQIQLLLSEWLFFGSFP